MFWFGRKEGGTATPMAESLRESADGLLRGLLTLQINTIEKASMTGEQVPLVPHALLDLAEGYLDYLQDEQFGNFPLNCQGQPDGTPSPWNMLAGVLDAAVAIRPPEDACRAERLFPPGQPAEPFEDELRLTAALFHALRQAAKAAIERGKLGPQGEHAVLNRIIANSDTVKAILQKPASVQAWQKVPDGVPRPQGVCGLDRADLVNYADKLIEPWIRMTADDRAIVRHAWEVGTEVICAQTVVQLTGDIVTRLHPNAPEEVRTMHQLGIGTSLAHWHALFGLVMSLAGKAIDSLAGRPGPR